MCIDKMNSPGFLQPFQRFLRSVNQGDQVIQCVCMLLVLGKHFSHRLSALTADLLHVGSAGFLLHSFQDIIFRIIYSFISCRSGGCFHNHSIGIQQCTVQIPDIRCHFRSLSSAGVSTGLCHYTETRPDCKPITAHLYSRHPDV